MRSRQPAASQGGRSSQNPTMIWDIQPPGLQEDKFPLFKPSMTFKGGQEDRNRRVQLKFIYEGKMLLRGCSFSDSQDMGGKPIY